MSEDRPVTAKDFEKLLKAVQTTNKKLDAQAEGGIGGSIRARFQGIGDAIKAPLDSLEGAIKTPFEAVSGAIESVGEAVMKPFESFKNLSEGFKNTFGDNELEQQNSLLGDIRDELREQTTILLGEKLIRAKERTTKQVKKAGGGIVDEVIGNISTLATIKAGQFGSEKLGEKKGVLGLLGKGLGALGGVGQVVSKPSSSINKEEVQQLLALSDKKTPKASPIFQDPSQTQLFEPDLLGVELVTNEIKNVTEGVKDLPKFLRANNEILERESNKQLELGLATQKIVEGQFELDLQTSKDTKRNDLREAELRREGELKFTPDGKGGFEKVDEKQPKGKGFLGGIMSFLGQGVMALANGATAFAAFVKPLLIKLVTFGKVIGKVFMGLSKLFVPLTIALGIVGAILGGIKGFKEDGFAGLISGLISGAFDMLVGGLLAAIGSLGTGLLNALGLSNMAKAFQEGLNDVFELLRMTILLPVNLLKGLFTGDFELIKETIANLYKMLFKTIVSGFKMTIATLFELPVLIGKAIIGLGAGILKVIGGIGMALFNALKVIFADIPMFIGDAIISGLTSLFSLFAKLPGAIAAGIGALVPGGKSPGEAFMAALTSGGEGEEEKPEKKSQRRTKRTKTAVEKVVATQEERDFTMAAESFERSDANLKAFESEAGGDFTIKEKLREGGDASDPTDYMKEKVYNDPKKQKQFEALKEVRDKALRLREKLGGGLVKAFKAKFGEGLRGRTIADTELSLMGGREGFLEKIQNRTGAIMQQEQTESMNRAAARQAFLEKQGDRDARGRVINAPTKNNVVNTTINEAPNHVDRTTQLFGALPPGMAY